MDKPVYQLHRLDTGGAQLVLRRHASTASTARIAIQSDLIVAEGGWDPGREAAAPFSPPRYLPKSTFPSLTNGKLTQYMVELDTSSHSSSSLSVF